ncbi:MAG: hypothetical protein NTW50_01335 [Candidatus Berkelbacteria bacterium]|nr:hypothetical protein [Candidatus Berkelbacteria bacterium]
MNCQEITSKIDDIFKEISNFDINIRKSPIVVGEIMKSRESVVLITNEILNSFDPAIMFIEKLKDPATWERFDSKIEITKVNDKNRISCQESDEFVEDIFAQLGYYNSIRSESFASLIKYLDSIKSWLCDHLESLKNDNDSDFFSDPKFETYNLLKSMCNIFLCKTMKPDSDICVENLPEEMAGSFARSLAAGRIVLDSASKHLGVFMSGGEIVVKNGGTQAGEHMWGGRIIITKQTSGATGYSMKGGKIYVNRHLLSSDEIGDSPFGYESDHGTLICKYDGVRCAGVHSGTDLFIDQEMGAEMGLQKSSGVIIANKTDDCLGRPRSGSRATWQLFGTLYAGQYTDTAPERSEIETFTFDHQLGQYIDLRQKQNAPIVSDDESLAQFKAKRCGLVVVESLANIKENITDGMDGGIIVLKELPKSELGKSMNRGAVIIDIPKIRREEILAVLSKDRD